MSGTAWVTLATNDSYSLGALVLAHSLRQLGTAHQLAVLVTPGVSGVMREKLASVFNLVKEVNVLDSRDEANLRLLQRPDLGITFTKLHCWRLTQYNKCVFLDADTMVLQNADELFEREEFSAAPDVGWPDCFNSGVFVYRPSEETYGKLVQFALEKGSFDGGDQGLLNLYFSDWAHKDISKHLPFIYNMCSTACYSYLPAFKQFGGNVKIIHFIGNSKPWLQYFDTETRQVHVTPNLHHLHEYVQKWWNIFCSLVHPALSSEMARSSVTHYPSFDSSIRSVPFQRNIPLHYDSFSDNDNTNVQTTQSDNVNAWDPWDEYEQNQDETPFVSQSSDTGHTEHSQNFENVPESFAQYEPSTESFQTHDTNVHDSNSSEQFHSESRTINDNISNIHENPQTFSTDNNKTPHESEYFDSHPPQESFNMTTSHDSHTTIAHIPSECNQLARPLECEPASCVTTENALHDKPSEVHDGNAGLAGAFARLTLGVPRTAEQSLLEDHLRRQGWEVGNIDYMGRDSFDNIWSKICATLDAPAVPAPAQPEPAAPEPAAPAPAAPAPAAPAPAAPVPAPTPSGPSPAAAPVQPQVPEPVKASEIDSAPKPVAPAQSEPVPQAEIKPAAAPSEVPKPPAESCPIAAPAAKPAEPESPKPAPPSPSDAPSQPAVCPKPSTPSDIPPPAAVAECPKPEAKAPEPEKPAQAAVAPPISQAAPPKAEPAPAQPQQTPPPSPKVEAAPAPIQPQAPPPSPKAEPAQPQPAIPPSPKAEPAQPQAAIPPSPKAEPAQPQAAIPPSPKPEPVAAPVAPKSEPTPPASPAPKAEAPKLPQPPKTEAAPAKSQKTPPSSPSPKAETAPPKLQQTPPSTPSPKSQPKAAPAKEAAEAPASPTSPQPKAPGKKAEAAAPEKAPAEEAGAASGGQGPTPPPRKTAGGGASTKKSGKGKK